MNNQRKATLFLCLFGLLFLTNSCVLDFFLEKESPPLPGKYISLPKDNIKLFVPETFEKISIANYQKQIEAVEDSVKKKNLLKRLNQNRISKGNLYYVADDAIEMTVKMRPYFVFSKKESSYISGLFLKSCYEFSEMYNSNCERLRSGYSGNKKTQVFKGVYKVETNDETYFNTNYIISSNKKTFSILLISSFDLDFDAYIEKIIVE